MVVLPLVPVTNATSRDAVRCWSSCGSTLSPDRPPATVPCPRPRRRDVALTARVVSDGETKPHEGGLVRASSSAVGSWRTQDSSGSKVEIAAMIAAVSATGVGARQHQRVADPDGDPRRVAHEGEVGRPGGSRPHLLRAPDPDGDHDGSRRGGQAGRPRLSLQDGIEERLTPRDGALRQHDDHLARPQRRFGRPQRLIGPAAPVDRDPPDGPGDGADHRGVEDLLLAQEPHRPAQPGGHEGECRHVEVAPVIGGQQDRPLRRDVIDAGEIEARVGERRRADERPQQVVGLEPHHARDARAAGPSTRSASGVRWR